MTTSDIPGKLFVYGSLMQGFFNYNKALMGKIHSSVPARVQGNLYHLQKDGYPALVPGDGWVFGELIELKNFKETIVHLDQIENYRIGNKDNEYERLMTLVEVIDTGTKEQAYVYWYNLSLDTEDKSVISIKDGNWRNFMMQYQADCS